MHGWHCPAPPTDQFPIPQLIQVFPTNDVPAGHGIVHLRMIRACQPASLSAIYPALEKSSSEFETRLEENVGYKYPSGPARYAAAQGKARATLAKSFVEKDARHVDGIGK